MNNNNIKYAIKVLQKKSFELKIDDYRCVIKVLDGEVDKNKFKEILLRFRRGHYHL